MEKKEPSIINSLMDLPEFEPEKTVLPALFGGLENWFFTGPSGEQIELLKML